MTESAAKGKRTRLANGELARLAREGHSPAEIAHAFGIQERHVVQRLRDQGLDTAGDPLPTLAAVPPRKPVVQWLASESEEWRGEAACAGIDPLLWHPESGSGRATYAAATVKMARSVCATCPVSLQCLDVALRAEKGLSLDYRHGIYAGLTPAQRLQLDPGEATR